jgi:hypothetical protein
VGTEFDQQEWGETKHNGDYNGDIIWIFDGAFWNISTVFQL